MRGDKIYSKASELRAKIIEQDSKATEEKRHLFYNYLELLKKAAYLGHKEAMYDYAQQFEDMGILGLQNPLFNLKRRNFWYHKAMENGHPEAHNNLASIYTLGEGVEKDYEKALEFYRKSAELGSVLGKKNYKIMLKHMAKGGLYNK